MGCDLWCCVLFCRAGDVGADGGNMLPDFIGFLPYMASSEFCAGSWLFGEVMGSHSTAS